MDGGVIFALVLAVIFFGGVGWLVVHSRRSENEDASESQQEHKPISQEPKSVGKKKNQ
jgi:hypothetical protein